MRRNGKTTQRKAEWLDAMLKRCDEHPGETQVFAVAHRDGTKVYEMRRTPIEPVKGWRITHADVAHPDGIKAVEVTHVGSDVDDHPA